MSGRSPDEEGTETTGSVRPRFWLPSGRSTEEEGTETGLGERERYSVRPAEVLMKKELKRNRYHRRAVEERSGRSPDEEGTETYTYPHLSCSRGSGRSPDEEGTETACFASRTAIWSSGRSPDEEGTETVTVVLVVSCMRPAEVLMKKELKRTASSSRASPAVRPKS